MIEILQLNFGYSRKKPLFKDLDLQMEAGKIYGLLGKNGTGKSTLLKLIVGALFPKTGTVKLSDFHSRERHPDMLNDLFLLPEDFSFPSIRISEFVKAYSPFYPKFDKDRFEELLGIFEVDKGRKLSELSFGQRKKVIISFGMATNVRYLLMDEPTNGLDIPSKSQFRKALLKGFQEHQTMIISTHQIRDLNQLIEAVIIIEDGKIIFNQEVFGIEDKLYFSKSLVEEQLPELLYVEAATGGYVHIQPNRNNKSSQVELEVLFNAVIQNPESINQHL